MVVEETEITIAWSSAVFGFTKDDIDISGPGTLGTLIDPTPDNQINYVGNLNQSGSSADADVYSGKTIAQKFTTASGLSDHRLLNLQLDIKTAPNDPDGVTVKIKAVADDGTPGDDVYTLTNPSNLNNDGIRSFTATSDATQRTKHTLSLIHI